MACWSCPECGSVPKLDQGILAPFNGVDRYWCPGCFDGREAAERSREATERHRAVARRARRWKRWLVWLAWMLDA